MGFKHTLKINDLKRNLKELTKEELIKSIVDLYKKSEFVKDYYFSKYVDDSNLSILIKHKNVIENEFFPSRDYDRGRLAVAKKSITEFKKLSDNKKSIAELMLFYVEVGVSIQIATVILMDHSILAWKVCMNVLWSIYRAMILLVNFMIDFVKYIMDILMIKKV